jgi:hypothetical protein
MKLKPKRYCKDCTRKPTCTRYAIIAGTEPCSNWDTAERRKIEWNNEAIALTAQRRKYAEYGPTMEPRRCISNSRRREGKPDPKRHIVRFGNQWNTDETSHIRHTMLTVL